MSRVVINGLLWHNCATHRHAVSRKSNPSMKQPANGQTSGTASPNKSVKRKKLQAPLPYEQLLAEDVARAKRKFDALDVSFNGQCITLGYAKHRAIKKNFLGPVLKQRFLGTEFGDS